MKINGNLSVKKFVVDECISTDVTFDEEPNEEIKQFFEEESYKEGEVYVFEGYIKDIDEVDEIEE